MGRAKSIVVAFIRTSLVPPLAGYLLTWLVSHGIKIETGLLYSLVTIILSGIWYLVFHMVEVLASNPKVKKWAGIFLGYSSTPNYEEKK